MQIDCYVGIFVQLLFRKSGISSMEICTKYQMLIGKRTHKKNYRFIWLIFKTQRRWIASCFVEFQMSRQFTQIQKQKQKQTKNVWMRIVWYLF